MTWFFMVDNSHDLSSYTDNPFITVVTPSDSVNMSLVKAGYVNCIKLSVFCYAFCNNFLKLTVIGIL